MFDCLSLSMAPWGKIWRRAIMRLCIKLGSWPLIYPAIEIELPGEGLLASPHSGDNPNNPTYANGNMPTKRAVYVLKSKKEEITTGCNRASAEADSARDSASCIEQLRYASNGGYSNVSLFTKQGQKGVNQDAMIVWEKFASQEDLVFCGVFDGHGPDGHRVARNVRDVLPQKLAASWKSTQQVARDNASSSDDSENESSSQREMDYSGDGIGDPSVIMAWKESFVAAYKVTDRELLVNDYVDCVSSGTTAVTLVKHGNDLIVGNVGDSRAVLGTRAADDTLLALPLTVDLKPNVPREAERIRRHKGRVFALQKEPRVHRVWLPHQNAPGLAMARALGDYCLKNHGVISEPEVTYRRLTNKDEFVVLATDGIWDVLTNEQVVEMVASAPDKSQVARTIVERAVYAWKSRQAALKADDCAVVCLFL
ncbi:hypothetical protein GOP47_0010280 [Adiantum capillus-veneris]|uniref:PPM-type phosphatase domain-containing protein n=1 Tax=Adiantum capillus-veneris TaxID=13818 RepID=A0A9D4ZG93_ADICA|nr:hypothetical protein GOP47_0010280 [Adiantum capillus-veneris]